MAKATAALDSIDRALKPNDADILMKAFAAKDAEINRLQKMVNELLAEPAPPKTAGAYGLVSVSKEADAGGGHSLEKTAGPTQDEIAKALSDMTEQDRALLLIKTAQQLPRPLTMSRPAE